MSVAGRPENTMMITEITLSSGLDDESHLQPECVNVDYTQDQKFKGIKRSFSIFNETQMYYTLKSFTSRASKKHRVNLCYVKAKPDREVTVAWKWLGSAFACIFWSMLLLYVGLYTKYTADYLVIVGVLLATFSLLSVLVFYYRTQDRLVYRSFVGNIPLFEVSSQKPGNREFDTFIAKLIYHIEKGHSRLSMKQRLAGELRELRRIRDEGTITAEQYESARDIIFRHEAYQASQKN